MPFGRSSVDAKREFIELARMRPRNMSELCRRFGVSRTLGYELLRRAQRSGEEAAVVERSRRPQHSPTKSSSELEERVLAIRDQTHWGARKIADLLAKEEQI